MADGEDAMKFRHFFQKILAETLPQDMPPQIAPALPAEAPDLSLEQLALLERFRDRAETLQNFEGMQNLIDMALQELRLTPVDRTRLAGVLNQYRQEKGLPLF